MPEKQNRKLAAIHIAGIAGYTGNKLSAKTKGQ